jgi:hypothetical protein
MGSPSGRDDAAAMPRGEEKSYHVGLGEDRLGPNNEDRARS